MLLSLTLNSMYDDPIDWVAVALLSNVTGCVPGQCAIKPVSRDKIQIGHHYTYFCIVSSAFDVWEGQGAVAF